MDQTVRGYIIGSICITGIIANGISLYTFCRGVVKTATTYQLQVLAAVDTLYLLSRFISSLFLDVLYYTATNTQQYWIELVYDHIVTPCLEVSYTASIWLTVFIALYRYLAVCKAFSDSYRHVEKHGQKYVLLVLVVSIVYSLPIVCVFLLDYHGHIRGATYWLVYKVIYVSDTLVQFLVPLIILTVVTVKLVNMIRKRAQLRRDMGRAPIAEDNSISIILVVILITFLICQLPYGICRIWWILISSGYAFSANARRVYRYFLDAQLILLPVNSAANGFIYFFCNKHFRRDLVSHCKCRSTV